MERSIHKKLALTSLTSGVRSVGIVRLRTEAMKFIIIIIITIIINGSTNASVVWWSELLATDS
jgi:hypothetical protein